MSFISVAFIGCYVIAMALRLTVGRRTPVRAYCTGLLLLSLFFYAWHVPAYILLIAFSTVVDYTAGRWLAGVPVDRIRQRQAIVAASVCLNLGLLGYFKYAGFMFELVTEISQAFGVAAPSPTLDILLPIGISFYTFQSMSYTIDVYRGNIPAEHRLDRFALYVAFFPQLVAGPIVRAGAFLYQLDRSRPPRLRVFLEGAYLIIRGLFLKMVVADNLGIIVDDQWENTSKPGASQAASLSILVFFSCQLLCDFAGYTDIARGIAYQLGFRLPINFNAPFIAGTFNNFWRRWHISLSNWMRDYIYLPLGGNRHGQFRASFNLMTVMLLSGLWHGAGLNFLIWGAIHGMAVLFERLLGIARRDNERSAGRGTQRVLYSVTSLLWFVGVQLTWILSMAFFRSADSEQAWQLLQNAVSGLLALVTANVDAPDEPALFATGWWFTVPVWIMHARALASERSRRFSVRHYERAVYSGVMLCAILTLYATSEKFIYFQF